MSEASDMASGADWDPTARKAVSKGPQLTQRKLDKLRDALNVVLETDQVQAIPLFRGRFTETRFLLDKLSVPTRGTVSVVGGYGAGPKKVSELEPPPTAGIGARPPE